MKTRINKQTKKIKNEIEFIIETIIRLDEAESAQNEARNNYDYNEAKNKAKEASEDLMESVKEIVRLASAIGCANELYDIHTYHKVVEYDIRNSYK